MITECQRNVIWENMLAAEVRSMYFAELASCHYRRKQFIVGASFFLSSGAAATLAAKMPNSLPLVLSVIVALLTAYSIAFGLDKRASTMSKLHYQWNHLNADPWARFGWKRQRTSVHSWNHLSAAAP